MVLAWMPWVRISAFSVQGVIVLSHWSASGIKQRRFLRVTLLLATWSVMESDLVTIIFAIKHK